MADFDRIYRQNADIVFRFLLSMTGSADLAEELTQETFYQAVKSIGRYQGNGKISSWLCGIARNVLLAYRRKARREEPLPEEEDFGQYLPSAEETFLRKEEAAAVLEAIRRAREPGREILNYVRFLSGLRRNHRILQQRTPFRLMDTLACGYPDLSFHGREAWRPDFGPYSHAVGVMYCGLYEESEHHDFLFAAFNMHWTPVTFALPKLPGQMRWYLLSDTAEETEHPRGQLLKEQTKVTCTECSVRILVGRGPCSLPSRRKKHTE